MKRHVPLFEDFGNVLKNAGVTAGGEETEERPQPDQPDTEVMPGEKPAPTRRERRDPNKRRPGYVPEKKPAKALLRIVKEAFGKRRIGSVPHVFKTLLTRDGVDIPIIVRYTISGSYRAATLEDPEEYPEYELLSVVDTEGNQIEDLTTAEEDVIETEAGSDFEKDDTSRRISAAQEADMDMDEAVHYDDPEKAKMHPELEDTLRTGAHPYKEHPSFPAGTEESQTAQEIASDQFNTVVNKLKYYLGDQVNVESFDQMTVYRILVASLQEITRLESEHKEQLEEMAVRTVMEYFNIKEGDFIFDAKIVDVGEVDISMIKKQEDALEDAAQEEMEEGNEEEVLTLPGNPEDLEQMMQKFAQQAEIEIDKDAQVSKRRMINALIQGAANNSQYLFNFLNDELRAIDPDLPKLYGMMISSNDLNYWLWSDEQIKAAQDQESGAGSEEVDAKTEPPTIKARGINLPVLIHELVKGVMKYYAMFGLPGGKAAESVLSKTEFLNIEKWDLRFGPSIWRKFVSAVGVDDWDEIKQYLIVEINEMPAGEFNAFMKELISGSDEGKRKIVELARKVREGMGQDRYKDAMEEALQFNETFVPDFRGFVRNSCIVNEKKKWAKDAKPEKGKMHDLLGVPEDKKIIDVYTSGDGLADALIRALKKKGDSNPHKTAASMLAFAANVDPKQNVLDAALKAVKEKGEDKK